MTSSEPEREFIEAEGIFAASKDDSPWEPILRDPALRPNLTRLADEIRNEIAAGLATPMKFEDS